VSDISLHWTPAGLALIALLAGSPGLIAGLVLGAVGWRNHRLPGAALGALLGFALTLSVLWICFSTPIAQADGFGGAAATALSICWPGLLLGGALAAMRFRNRWIVAAWCGGAIGAVAWLGGWAAFA
jgi:hypothetical protein